MLLSLEPRGQESRPMLWLSPRRPPGQTLQSRTLLFPQQRNDPHETQHTQQHRPEDRIQIKNRKCRFSYGIAAFFS